MEAKTSIEPYIGPVVIARTTRFLPSGVRARHAAPGLKNRETKGIFSSGLEGFQNDNNIS
ncbi:hypothetical protein DL95DRAFT_382033, partial [Leptodontidium sp. 2 PMI_412]